VEYHLEEMVVAAPTEGEEQFDPNLLMLFSLFEIQE
jgi:hypothetical protein